MRSRIVPTAMQFVDWLKEATGANDGAWVEAVQRITGNKRGDPWCASWVTFVLDIAYKGKNPLRRTASCDLLLADAKRKGWLVTDPEPGDVFLVMRTAEDAVHTGFVTTAAVDQQVGTVEGNTNAGGSRDGWGVFARTRPVKALKFIRLPV